MFVCVLMCIVDYIPIKSYLYNYNACTVLTCIYYSGNLKFVHVSSAPLVT